MAATQGRKIAVVGASGSLGSQTVKALLAYGIHTVTAISRAGSSATFPPGVIVKRGPYDDEDFLVNALKGQDVLIITVFVMALESQIPLIKAAAKAGVPWIIPTEFGSDNLHKKLNEEIGLMTYKNKYRKLIEELGVSSWIGVINGPWFDWSFTKSYWGIDVKARKATIFDGNVLANTTTLPKVGKALAAVLSLPDSRLKAFKNEFVYFSSFLLSHRDILNSVILATGTTESDWSIETKSADQAAEDAKAAIKKGDGMKNVDLLFATIFREGFGGNYEAKVTLNKELALEQEDLNSVVKELVKDL